MKDSAIKQAVKQALKSYPSFLDKKHSINTSKLYCYQSSIFVSTGEYFSIIMNAKAVVQDLIEFVKYTFSSFQINPLDGSILYVELFGLIVDVFRIIYLISVLNKGLKSITILYISVWNITEGEMHPSSAVVTEFLCECEKPLKYIEEQFCGYADKLIQTAVAISQKNKSGLTANGQVLSSTAFLKGIIYEQPTIDNEINEVQEWMYTVSNLRKLHTMLSVVFMICSKCISKSKGIIDEVKTVIKYSPTITICPDMPLNIVNVLVKRLSKDSGSQSAKNVVATLSKLVSYDWSPFYKGRREAILASLKSILHKYSKASVFRTMNVVAIMCFARDEIMHYLAYLFDQIQSQKKGTKIVPDFHLMELINPYFEVGKILYKLKSEIVEFEKKKLSGGLITLAIKLLDETVRQSTGFEILGTYFSHLQTCLTNILDTQNFTEERESSLYFSIKKYWDTIYSGIAVRFYKMPSDYVLLNQIMQSMMSHISLICDFDQIVGEAACLLPVIHLKDSVECYYRAISTINMELIAHVDPLLKLFTPINALSGTLHKCDTWVISTRGASYAQTLYMRMAKIAAGIVHELSLNHVDSEEKLRRSEADSHLTHASRTSNLRRPKICKLEEYKAQKCISEDKKDREKLLRELLIAICKNPKIQMHNLYLNPRELFLQQLAGIVKKFIEMCFASQKKDVKRTNFSENNTPIENFVGQLPNIKTPHAFCKIVYCYCGYASNLVNKVVPLDVSSVVLSAFSAQTDLRRSKKYIDTIFSTPNVRLKEWSFSHNPKLTPIMVTYILLYLFLFDSSSRPPCLYFDPVSNCLKLLKSSEKSFFPKYSDTIRSPEIMTTQKELTAFSQMVGIETLSYVETCINHIISKHAFYTRSQISKHAGSLRLAKSLISSNKISDLLTHPFWTEYTKISYTATYNTAIALTFTKLLKQATRNALRSTWPAFYDFFSNTKALSSEANLLPKDFLKNSDLDSTIRSFKTGIKDSTIRSFKTGINDSSLKGPSSAQVKNKLSMIACQSSRASLVDPFEQLELVAVYYALFFLQILEIKDASCETLPEAIIEIISQTSTSNEILEEFFKLSKIILFGLTALKKSHKDHNLTAAISLLIKCSDIAPLGKKFTSGLKPYLALSNISSSSISLFQKSAPPARASSIRISKSFSLTSKI